MGLSERFQAGSESRNELLGASSGESSVPLYLDTNFPFDRLGGPIGLSSAGSWALMMVDNVQKGVFAR
jgi:hypothetical protein